MLCQVDDAPQERSQKAVYQRRLYQLRCALCPRIRAAGGKRKTASFLQDPIMEEASWEKIGVVICGPLGQQSSYNHSSGLDSKAVWTLANGDNEPLLYLSLQILATDDGEETK